MTTKKIRDEQFPSLTKTDAERHDHCAAHICLRESEMSDYEANIEMYENIINDPESPPDVIDWAKKLYETEWREYRKSRQMCRILKKHLTEECGQAECERMIKEKGGQIKAELAASKAKSLA